jgi:hypothetical protein
LEIESPSVVPAILASWQIGSQVGMTDVVPENFIALVLLLPLRLNNISACLSCLS